MRMEINLSADSRWSRQLAHLRTDISDLLKNEIESIPRRVRRLVGPYSGNENRPGSTLDHGASGKSGR
jgi:hypothetical protein